VLHFQSSLGIGTFHVKLSESNGTLLLTAGCTLLSRGELGRQWGTLPLLSNDDARCGLGRRKLGLKSSDARGANAEVLRT